MKKTSSYLHNLYLNVAPDHGDIVVSVRSLHLMAKSKRMHQLVNDNGDPDAVATVLTGRLLQSKLKSTSINSIYRDTKNST